MTNHPEKTWQVRFLLLTHEAWILLPSSQFDQPFGNPPPTAYLPTHRDSPLTPISPPSLSDKCRTYHCKVDPHSSRGWIFRPFDLRGFLPAKDQTCHDSSPFQNLLSFHSDDDNVVALRIESSCPQTEQTSPSGTRLTDSLTLRKETGIQIPKARPYENDSLVQ